MFKTLLFVFFVTVTPFVLLTSYLSQTVGTVQPKLFSTCYFDSSFKDLQLVVYNDSFTIGEDSFQMLDGFVYSYDSTVSLVYSDCSRIWFCTGSETYVIWK